MAQMNGKEVKEQIKRTIDSRGPSLPVHIAKAVSMSSLFASAFLSELASEGIVKISHMKVGGSPLYFLPGQEEKLENFINFLSPKEREALELLKSKGILEDDKQHPAIRVALRALRDFAVPIKKGEQLLWKYFTFKEEITKAVEDKVQQAEVKPQEKIEETKPRMALSGKMEEIKVGEKRESAVEQSISKPPKPRKQKKVKIKEDFLNEIKKMFAQKGIEIEKIESFDNKQVFARVRVNNNIILGAAYNKKKIGHEDLMKAYKKAITLGMSYCIFSKGDLNKKAKETIEAYKKFSGIEKISSSEEISQNTPSSK